MDPQSSPKPSGVRTVLIGSAIALTVAGFGVFSYIMLRPTSERSLLTTTTFSADKPTNDLSIVGRLEPEGGVVKIAAPSVSTSARVGRLLVNEGASVRANQPVAVMDEGDALYAALLQAEAQVKAAGTRLAQVQAGANSEAFDTRRASLLKADADIPKAESELLKATTELRDAQQEYDRYRSLFQNGAIAGLDLQNRQVALEAKTEQQRQARQTLEQAKLSLAQAKQDFNRVSEVRPSEVDAAKAQVDVAVATFRKAKADLEKAIVKAPIDGQVLKVYANAGEVVGADGIMELGKTKQMYAVTEINETNIGKVRLGQKAKITSDILPGEMTGTVARVGLQNRKNSGFTNAIGATEPRVLEVKIRLDNSQAVSRFTGLQVKVAIVP